MTIGELIGELQKHDPSLKVAAQWDMSYSSIDDIFVDAKVKALIFEVSSYGSFDREA